MKFILPLYLFLCVVPLKIYGQYQFSGNIDKSLWKGNVYLSLVEDYRKISGIYPEQIIQKTTPDSTGYFSFSGDFLPLQNRIYRVQVENCNEKHKNQAHLNGFCTDSKEVLFIAHNTDTISLPFSFDKEMFCQISSTNESSNAFIEVDSIINEMRFAFGNYRSITNRKINSEKWLHRLQQFVYNKNEPLIELYVYGFVSDKTNELHPYYLKDLEKNSYYDQLLERLQNTYPNSPYADQYRRELASDRFLSNSEKPVYDRMWFWILGVVFCISLLINILQWLRYRKKSTSSTIFSEKKLTQQEQKILSLILDDKTNKEIASLIFVSVSTVKTHINNLYKKLGVSSREEVKSLYNRPS